MPAPRTRRDARLGGANLWPHHMHDTAMAAAPSLQFNTERLTVALQRFNLELCLLGDIMQLA